VVNLVILYYGHLLFGVPKDGTVHLTILFNVFVLCQVFNELNARKINDGTSFLLPFLLMNLQLTNSIILLL